MVARSTNVARSAVGWYDGAPYLLWIVLSLGHIFPSPESKKKLKNIKVTTGLQKRQKNRPCRGPRDFHFLILIILKEVKKNLPCGKPSALKTVFSAMFGFLVYCCGFLVYCFGGLLAVSVACLGYISFVLRPDGCRCVARKRIGPVFLLHVMSHAL